MKPACGPDTQPLRRRDRGSIKAAAALVLAATLFAAPEASRPEPAPPSPALGHSAGRDALPDEAARAAPTRCNGGGNCCANQPPRQRSMRPAAAALRHLARDCSSAPGPTGRPRPPRNRSASDAGRAAEVARTRQRAGSAGDPPGPSDGPIGVMQHESECAWLAKTAGATTKEFRVHSEPSVTGPELVADERL